MRNWRCLNTNELLEGKYSIILQSNAHSLEDQNINMCDIDCHFFFKSLNVNLLHNLLHIYRMQILQNYQ